ncbi:MAG TPA: YgaP-like transmembrane domain [Streptosporangiaceae bacterium]|nr:YgaP-like transmembrane domain [Streptosporangiaceae bacterium]
MRVVKLMNGLAGRSARALAGLALIAGGIAVGGTGGLVIAIIGVFPLAAGATGVCLAAPLLRAPLRAR